MSRTPRKKPRRTVPPKDLPVVRMTTPAQMVAALPLHLGYTPQESLVVMCCHEPRGRMGLTFRLDLPTVEHERDVVDYCAQTVRGQQATRVVLVVYTGEADGEERARERLMNQLLATFEDLVVTEALLVRDGRFWSYQCDDTRCCPVDGTPVDAAEESAAVQVLKLEQLTRGAGMLATREDLERTIAGPVFLAEEAALDRCDEAVDALLEAIAAEGLRSTRGTALARWRVALEAMADPRWEPDDAEAVALTVSLSDVVVRDAVAGMWEQDDLTLRRLLESVARRTPGLYDAPVCTTLAWVTYCDGAGSITSIALERALRSDPEYSMAQILDHALRNAFDPDFVRDVTRRTRAAVQERLDEAA
ncbi:MAG: uncharacterized protein JWO22_2302 [Frankiales bacterium]|nr:uncharacterized protein [Frankiales bacterium]